MCEVPSYLTASDSNVDEHRVCKNSGNKNSFQLNRLFRNFFHQLHLIKKRTNGYIVGGDCEVIYTSSKHCWELFVGRHITDMIITDNASYIKIINLQSLDLVDKLVLQPPILILNLWTRCYDVQDIIFQTNNQKTGISFMQATFLIRRKGFTARKIFTFLKINFIKSQYYSRGYFLPTLSRPSCMS